MNRMIFCSRLVVMVAILAIFAPAIANAEDITLRFGHVGAPGSLYAVTSDEFAKRVNEALEGRVEVVTFGSSQLGRDREMLQKLRLGTLDMSLPSTIMSTVADEFGLFELPYLIADREHMKRIEADLFWSELAPAAEARGYKILAVWENGFRHITNSRRPINTPADLDGIKLRTPNGIWRVNMFRAYGANPTPMAFSEVFTALQTGVIDGQENPLTQVTSAKLFEVQTYLSLTGHVYSPAFITVGLRRWNRLPEDVRSVIERIAREVQPFAYETAATMDIELLAQLREAGMQVNTADRAAFVEASGVIYDAWAASVDGAAALIERANALAR